MRGKLKEKYSKMKKNRVLNYKNAFEDQFIAFVSSVLELSLFSHTIAHIEHFSIRGSKERKDKERKGQARKVGSSSFNRKICK